MSGRSRRALFASAAALSAILAAAALSACNALTGLSDREFVLEPDAAEACADPDVDCPKPESECLVAVCEAGACGVAPAPAMTPIAAQTPGDCSTAVCDGSGGVTAVATVDDIEDDGKECTEDACDGTSPSHTRKPAKTACSEGGGALCSAEGVCVTCVDDGDCVMPNTCDDAAGACACPEPCPAWNKHYAGADIPSIALGPGGDIVLGATFTGTIDAGGTSLTSAGGADILVSQLDASGATKWAKAFGDVMNQEVKGVAVDDVSGNVLLAGSFLGALDFGGGPLMNAALSDIFLAQLSPEGGHVWSRQFGDDKSQAMQSVAARGGAIVGGTGFFEGTVDFDGGALASGMTRNAFVARFDAGGGHVFSKALATAQGNASGSSVALDGSGNALVTGEFDGVIDFGLGQVASAGARDMFVAKLGPAGNTLWNRRFGDQSEQLGTSVAVDPGGGALAAGVFMGAVDLGGETLTSAGSLDGFVVKLSADTGSRLWSKQLSGPADERVDSVAVYPNGDVLIAGSFMSASVEVGGEPLTSAGGADIFMARLAGGTGDVLWATRFGDSESQIATCAAVDASGSALLAGTYSGSLDFGLGPLPLSNGAADIFLVKFTP
jgi:outer membrane protein assembly factor BamB